MKTNLFFTNLNLARYNLNIRRNLLLVTSFIIFINVHAQRTWEKNFINGTNSVIETYDHKYITAGSVRIGMQITYSIMVLDAEGEICYDTIFTDGHEGAISKLKATPDSGYLVVGYQEFDNFEYLMYILKFNKYHSLEWEKKYPIGKAFNVINTKDGYTILGSKPKYENLSIKHNLLLLQLDFNGDTVCTKNYKDIFINEGIEFTNNLQVLPASDTSYYFLGIKNTLASLFEMNQKGDSIWVKTQSNILDNAETFISTYDSCIIVINNNLSKIDLKGNTIWQKVNFFPICKQLAPSINRGFSGVFSDGRVVIYSAGGDTIWSAYKKYLEPNDIIFTSDSMFLVTGLYYDGGFIVKIDSTGKGFITTSIPGLQTHNDIITNYPNPFKASTTFKWNLPSESSGFIKVKILNIFGRVLFEKNIYGSKEFTFAPNDNTTGMLIFEIETKNKKYHKKIMRIK